METNPYLATQSSLSTARIETDHLLSDSGFSETELTAFTGKGRYPHLLMRRLEGKSIHAGFNVWAAIFGIQWFFFRKLYLFGLFSLVLEVGAPFASGWAIRFFFPGKGDLLFIVSVLFFFGIRVVIGFLANIALCFAATQAISKIDRMNQDNETHLRLITRAGGVSIPSLLLVYAALGIFRAMSN